MCLQKSFYAIAPIMSWQKLKQKSIIYYTLQNHLAI